MNYEEALNEIHSFERFGSRLGLDRMEGLMRELGDPHIDLKVIHVAGTNGKGSVCRYVYTVLLEQGYHVGAYFSPFLERFNERIEMDGSPIPDQELPVYTERVLHAVRRMLDRGLESPTEFEVVTAIGLLWFAEKKADFVVLEVGMGGRGDSTNIFPSPVVTAITSISWDHMAVLGDTLPKIAYEKAGIIKPGVPVAVFVKDAGALEVIRECAAGRGAPLCDVSRLPCIIREESLGGSVFDTMVEGREYRGMAVSMAGRHQIENALCALEILEQMRQAGYAVSDQAVRDGMRKAKQSGRLEILMTDPPLIIDGAHNPDGVSALTETLLRYFRNGNILLCTGILRDKKYEEMVQELCRLNADLIITEVPNPRTSTAEELADAFREQELYQQQHRQIRIFPSWEDAVEQSLKVRSEYQAVVWAGSLYLIGAVRSLVRRF